MIDKKSKRTTISGAAVGLRINEATTSKKWTFESDSPAIHTILKHYRRHPPGERIAVTGAALRATENYPLFLGALLSAAISVEKRNS